MYYRIYSENDQLIADQIDDLREAQQIEEDNPGSWVEEIVSCRECSEPAEARVDWYGHGTGYWCDSCYNSDRYPYKRGRY